MDGRAGAAGAWRERGAKDWALARRHGTTRTGPDRQCECACSDQHKQDGHHESSRDIHGVPSLQSASIWRHSPTPAGDSAVAAGANVEGGKSRSLACHSLGGSTLVRCMSLLFLGSVVNRGIEFHINPLAPRRDQSTPAPSSNEPAHRRSPPSAHCRMPHRPAWRSRDTTAPPPAEPPPHAKPPGRRPTGQTGQLPQSRARQPRTPRGCQAVRPGQRCARRLRIQIHLPIDKSRRVRQGSTPFRLAFCHSPVPRANADRGVPAGLSLKKNRLPKPFFGCLSRLRLVCRCRCRRRRRPRCRSCARANLAGNYSSSLRARSTSEAERASWPHFPQGTTSARSLSSPARRGRRR